MLYGVMTEGTGTGAQIPGHEAAGKTGTTQDYRDAYFIGYTPEIVAGVWVGFDTPESLGLTGAQAALPAWVKFMIAAAPGAPADFSEPSGITYATIDPETGGLATAGCPKAIELPFLIGSEPTMRCSVHGGTLASAPAAAPTFGMPPPSSEVVANAAMAAATPTPASSNVFGAIGNFFGGLFHR
jgi:membrane carboxypeptidase/penicillin-binding protein